MWTKNVLNLFFCLWCRFAISPCYWCLHWISLILLNIWCVLQIGSESRGTTKHEVEKLLDSSDHTTIQAEQSRLEEEEETSSRCYSTSVQSRLGLDFISIQSCFLHLPVRKRKEKFGGRKVFKTPNGSAPPKVSHIFKRIISPGRKTDYKQSFPPF